MLVPYFFSVSNVEEETTITLTKESMPIGDFLSANINSLLLDNKQFFSFNETFRVYQDILFHYDQYKDNKELFKPLNFQDKSTVLATLQTINVMTTQTAIGNLVGDLRSTDNTLSKQFGEELEIANNITYTDSFQKAFRAEAVRLTMGAANDGISHLIAAVDALWDSDTILSAKQRTQAAMKAIRFVMEKYKSWQVQFLDMMLVAQANPYTTDKDKNLVESKKTIDILKWGETLRKKGLIPFDKYPFVLEQFLRKIGVQENIIKLTAAICEFSLLTVNKRAHPLQIDLYDQKIINGVEHFWAKYDESSNVPPRIKREIDKYRGKDDVMDHALVLALYPSRVSSLINQSTMDNNDRQPKCALLDVEKGLSSWISNITDSLDTLEKAQPNSPSE